MDPLSHSRFLWRTPLQDGSAKLEGVRIIEHSDHNGMRQDIRCRIPVQIMVDVVLDLLLGWSHPWQWIVLRVHPHQVATAPILCASLSGQDGWRLGRKVGTQPAKQNDLSKHWMQRRHHTKSTILRKCWQTWFDYKIVFASVCQW